MKWSKKNGLVFNSDKLKSIVFSSRKSNNGKSFRIRSKGKSTQQEPIEKLLSVTFDQHLTWNEQINIMTKPNYNILRILKTFKRFTPWTVRKRLAESLILCRINDCIVVHSQIPKYLRNRLHRLQNCAAGYILGKYANTLDVINLNLLPVAENTELNVSKLACQGLHNKNWPEYLSIKLIERRRNIRSDKPGPMTDYGQKNTFQQQANKFLIRFQLILEYVKIKYHLSISLEVFIRIKP